MSRGPGLPPTQGAHPGPSDLRFSVGVGLGSGSSPAGGGHVDVTRQNVGR